MRAVPGPCKGPQADLGRLTTSALAHGASEGIFLPSIWNSLPREVELRTWGVPPEWLTNWASILWPIRYCWLSINLRTCMCIYDSVCHILKHNWMVTENGLNLVSMKTIPIVLGTPYDDQWQTTPTHISLTQYYHHHIMAYRERIWAYNYKTWVHYKPQIKVLEAKI